MSKLKSQSGSAIIMALVAIGVISSLAVYLMNMSADTNKKVVDDARIVSYKNLVEVVRNKIYSGNVCTTLLEGKVLTPDAFKRDKGMILNNLDLKLDMNKKPLVSFDKENPHNVWQIKGGTSIKDIKLYVSERVRAPVFFDESLLGSDPDLMIAAKGFIVIEPNHKGVGVYLDHNVHYRIPIFMYYKVVGANRILEACFEPEGEAFICTTSAFGAYDRNQNDPLKRCHPQRFCKQDGGGIKSSGSCTPPFEKKIIGEFPTGTLRFICSWCNSRKTNPICYTNPKVRFFDEYLNPPAAIYDETPFKAFQALTKDLNTGFPTNCNSAITPPYGGGSGGPGPGGGCFVAGTEITMFDGSKKLIEDVNLGDELVDINGNKVLTDKLVAYDYKGKIYSLNGGPYFFTPNHPFLTLDGWKSLDPEKSMKESPSVQVGMMKLGDVLIKRDGFEVIMSLDSIYSEEKVYNFSVSNSHEYIANDYAVHNLISPIK